MSDPYKAADETYYKILVPEKNSKGKGFRKGYLWVVVGINTRMIYLLYDDGSQSELENLNQFMNMDHMFIMRLAALLLAAALPAVCFRENPGCHMSCSCCWYLQKQLSHMPPFRMGGGSCFRVSFPYFFVFLLKEGQKAERVEKPCSPFTPRTGQLSDIITGSPISLSMEEPVPARPNP